MRFRAWAWRGSFQNIRLFANLSVIDNVQIAQHAHHKEGAFPSAILRTPGSLSREEAIFAAKCHGISRSVSPRPPRGGPGGEPLLWRPAAAGNRISALATRPRVLLLDEPGRGDESHREARVLMEMIRQLQALKFGLTILLGS